MARHKRKGGVKPPRKEENTAPAPVPAARASVRGQAPAPVRGQARARAPLSARQSSSTSGIQNLISIAALGYFAQKGLRPRLMPHGPAVKIVDRPSFATVDTSNDSLQGKHGKLTKIYERHDDSAEPLLKGPETVVINPKDGTIYALTEDALLVSLTDLKAHNNKNSNQKINGDSTIKDEEESKEASIMTAKATKVVDLGMGRPLGGRFTSDGRTIYIADAFLGLIRVVNPHSYPKAKVELVADRVMDNGTLTDILYANDLAIGPKSGKIYFTDSSDIMPDRIETRTWDTMYAAKTDLMRGKRMGRLLQYDPQKNEVKVLVSGLWFSNGVGIDKDETFVFVAETFALRLLKFHLTGPKEGTLETLVESSDMVGFPDGADCGSINKKQLCYSVMPSAVIPLVKLINKIPYPVDVWLRNLVMSLPKKFAPKIQPYGGVIQVDPTSKEIRYIQDPHAKDIGHLAGVTIWDNKLYLGSLTNSFVGVYDLN